MQWSALNDAPNRSAGFSIKSFSVWRARSPTQWHHCHSCTCVSWEYRKRICLLRACLNPKAEYGKKGEDRNTSANANAVFQQWAPSSKLACLQRFLHWLQTHVLRSGADGQIELKHLFQHVYSRVPGALGHCGRYMQCMLKQLLSFWGWKKQRAELNQVSCNCFTNRARYYRVFWLCTHQIGIWVPDKSALEKLASPWVGCWLKKVWHMYCLTSSTTPSSPGSCPGISCTSQCSWARGICKLQRSK